eukprot:3255839-Pyramimonas_sp.AAC.1
MPRWFRQRLNENDDAYWASDVVASEPVHGRRMNRPSDDRSLGVSGDMQVGCDISSRCAFQRAPAEWAAPEDLSVWT